MTAKIPVFEKAEVIRPHDRPLPDILQSQTQFYYFRHSGLRLRVMIAKATGDEPRGSIIFSPGRTEFIEKYLETAADFVRRNFNVLILDPRGQGLSERLVKDPLKSYIKDFQEYAEDIAAAAIAFENLLPKPHILMGHSMGGGIALQTVLSGAMRPAAVVCSAPMLGLVDIQTPVLGWIAKIASLTGLATANLPFQAQRNGVPIPFVSNKLTSDEERYRLWSAYFLTEERLRVGQPTFGWIVAALRSMAYINRHASELKIPALIVAAGGDPIVDPASNKDFAEKAGVEYHVVPGALHELFMERDEYRDQFFVRFDKFLEDNAL